MATDKEFVFKTLKELVENGFSLLKSDFSDAVLEKWLDYSQKIIEICTKDYASTIHLNYLRLLLALQRNHVSVRRTMLSCLDFLVEMLRIIDSV